MNLDIREKIRLLSLVGLVGILCASCSQETPITRPNPETGSASFHITKILFNGVLPSKTKFISHTLDSIEIFFSHPLDTQTITESNIIFRHGTVNAAGSAIVYDIIRGHSYIKLRLDRKEEFELGEKFELFVSKNIKSKDTSLVSLLDGVPFEYYTPLLEDANFEVFYGVQNDTVQANANNVFLRYVFNSVDITRIRLTLKVAKRGTLTENGIPYRLDSKNEYVGEFDFSRSSVRKFKVTAQSGNSVEYAIQILQFPPLTLTSDFSQGADLPTKYAARFDLSKPPPVSPALYWENSPEHTNSFIVIAWNESAVVNADEWFVINISSNLNYIPEGGLPNLTTVRRYEGFALPASGQSYVIHYSIIGIQEPSIDFSTSSSLDPTTTFNKLVEYVKDAIKLKRSVSPNVVVNGLTITGVADIYGVFTGE